jgi:hypothetical protein
VGEAVARPGERRQQDAQARVSRREEAQPALLRPRAEEVAEAPALPRLPGAAQEEVARLAPLPASEAQQPARERAWSR